MNKQAQQQAELHKQLWAMANDLRGNMAAANFKDYILGLIFYRFLSENLEVKINKLLEEDDLNYEEAWKQEEYRTLLVQELVDNSDIGYLIEPEYLYSSMIKKINSNKFDISVLAKAINLLEESTMGHLSQEDFEGLFEDMDLNSSKLGKGESERSSLIAKVMLKVNDIDFMHDDTEIDVLGDAYEYLIGQFAANAGKKAGEFYTPQAVSTILARVVTQNKGELRNVYDPTCGSGSLLLRVAKHTKKVGKFFGQENEPTTYNLARMNMLLHKVPFKRFDIHLGDTLKNPCETHKELKFDAIVANPPYSAKWSADDSFLHDERFSAYGRLAPKSKADYAFVQHMIHHLDDKGTMAVVLPHGVLFRSAAEEVIRKHIINKNYLDAVIGLPANIFFGTSIPTTILVFKKCKEDTDILFIDASNEFKKDKNQNILLPEHIDKILSTYENRETIDKYSFLATIEDIKENDYNLNIPRYVDTFEEEEAVDLNEVRSNLSKVNKEIEDITQEINKYLRELGEPEL
jgi:type I restriction enzyme M protein